MLELLHLGGRSLPHAVLMMIPEAWERHETMDPAKRAFYRFHASLMEPWDGPASIAFTDGTLIGAVLDRNGLRPSRYWVTDDDLVVMASEAGVIDIPPAPGRAQGPPAAGAHVPRRHRRRAASSTTPRSRRRWPPQHPYEDWLHAGVVELADLPEREHVVYSHGSVLRRQQVFGYTHEELKIILAPMARTGAEPIGSMGTDTPIAVLSDRPRLLFDYFSQLFAQVTNPPLDAIREELVTALGATIGPEHNLLDPGPASCRQIVLPFPIIDNDELAKIVHVNEDGDMPGFQAATDQRPVPRGRRRPGSAPGPRRHPVRGQPGHRRRRPHHRAVGPQQRRGLRADPVAAPDVGRAPPPDPGAHPDAGRPHRRSAATPARCTTWRCSSATAPAPSTRTWRSSPSRT